jgi:hypothetical protein
LGSVSGDEQSGWIAARGLQGDCVAMLRAGRHLFVFTRAGWAWRPAVCQGPAGLRRLTG